MNLAIISYLLFEDYPIPFFTQFDHALLTQRGDYYVMLFDLHKDFFATCILVFLDSNYCNYDIPT